MLAFIDESGVPHPNDDTRRPVLVALCMKEPVHRKLSGALFRYKRDLIGQEEPFDIKGTSYLRPRVFQNQPNKREFVEQLFELISMTELYIFAIIMERPSKPPFLEPGTLPFQHRRLLERINSCVTERCSEEDMAILIFDGQGMASIPTGSPIALAVSSYLFRHRAGQALSRILDTPLFVDSRLTPGIQLADIMASCIRQYHENDLARRPPGRDVFLLALTRYYRVVQSKTIDFERPDSSIDYGLHQMPERYHYPPDIPEEGAPDSRYQ